MEATICVACNGSGQYIRGRFETDCFRCNATGVTQSYLPWRAIENAFKHHPTYGGRIHPDEIVGCFICCSEKNYYDDDEDKSKWEYDPGSCRFRMRDARLDDDGLLDCPKGCNGLNIKSLPYSEENTSMICNCQDPS